MPTVSAKRQVTLPKELSLLEEPNIVFENLQSVWSALNDYSEAKSVPSASGVKQADFADALIVNKAKQTAQLRSNIMDAVYTSDQGALQLPGTKKL